MDRDVYASTAEQLLDESFQLATAVVMLISIYLRLQSMVTSLQRIPEVAARVLQSVRDRVKQLRRLIESTLLTIRWIACYGEISLLYAEDLTVYIRPRHHRFQPKRYRKLSEITRSDCDSWFGLRPAAMQELFLHWRIPTELRTSHREVFTGEECFIIFMTHLLKGRPYTEMARHTFGGDPREFSKMFNLMVDHLYFTFYYKNKYSNPL